LEVTGEREATIDACFPPLMVHVLPGVKRVPIFPKGRQIANAECKTDVTAASTLSVGFDPQYRVTFYAPRVQKQSARKGAVTTRKRTHLELATALGASLDTSKFPASTSAEAFQVYNHAAGRPCASGATKQCADGSDSE
jgi:hypothetical protein